MTRQDIYAVLVVYNDRLADSLTYRCIGDAGVNLIVCDNSTSDYGNEAFCADKPLVTYLNMGGNVGLPKAYNAAIDRVPDGDYIICLFDDDTEVPSEYFDVLLRTAAQQPETDIFAPLVYDKVGLLSPGISEGKTLVRARSLSQVTPQNITVINSAMAIRSRVFEDFRYDESMFLDFVDHAFIREMKARGKDIYLMRDVVLHQTCSGTTDNKKSAEKRFQIYRRDIFHYFRDEPGFAHYVLLKRRVRLCLTYKTLRFLFI